jgi:hypothetical protein
MSVGENFPELTERPKAEIAVSDTTVRNEAGTGNDLLKRGVFRVFVAIWSNDSVWGRR